MTSVNAKHEALLDELLKDYTNPQDILGEHGLLKQLTTRLVERALDAELTAHLGSAPHVRHGTGDGNTTPPAPSGGREPTGRTRQARVEVLGQARTDNGRRIDPDSSSSRCTSRATRRGTVAGADFHRALLKNWLGPRTVDGKLKKALRWERN